MERWVGKVAIVTGASSGIGATISEALVKEGLLVVGIARRLDKLEELSESLAGARGKFYSRQCDVTKDDEVLNVFEWVKDQFGGVDVLVNNAGISKCEQIIDGDIQTYRNIMDVNFMATALCVQQAVLSMQSRKVPGHIININSILGHFRTFYPLPNSVYAPSKLAMTSLSHIVRKELANAKSKVKMTNFCPGRVTTEIFAKCGTPDVEKLLKTAPFLETKDISDAVVYILGTPEHVQVSEFTIQSVGEAM